jgi:hypothetical protein
MLKGTDISYSLLVNKKIEDGRTEWRRAVDGMLCGWSLEANSQFKENKSDRIPPILNLQSSIFT